MAMFMAPLVVTNIRASISPRVTASDASESGGGSCASLGLTNAARELISRAESPEQWQIQLSYMNPAMSAPARDDELDVLQKKVVCKVVFVCSM